MIETPTFPRAAVAAPEAGAAEAGRVILAEGGNAIEAMVAMAATIAATYPHMNALGGDGFWLVREPGGRVHGIDACGGAGSGATIARYREAGYAEIPKRGPLAALTVAGAVGGWNLALELSRALKGRLPPRLLLADAVRRAKEGVPVTPSEARTVAHEEAALLATPGFVEAFHLDGAPPKAGALRRQPALAGTLQQLADAGLADFHRGDLAREIAADLERAGSPVTRADLEAYRARSVAPLSLRLGDAVVMNLPPPTQGLASLMILGIAARLDLGAPESFAQLHGLVEATKRAFLVRDALVTDPTRLPADPGRFLEPARLAREAAAVDMARAARWPAKPGLGDTVWMGAVDASGLAVSYIQSIYWEWGSGVVLPRTGVLWQNRGTAFSLDEGDLRALAPGAKPFHTLNPALAAFDDGSVMPYGAMGGDGQPQFQAQIYTRVTRGNPGQRMGLAAAVDAPRFLLGRSWGAPTMSLKLEDRFDSSLVAALERAGHEVEVLTGAYLDALGHAGALRRHRDGRVEAAHDPRSDGGAAGV